jgi:hypothetical protein
MYHEISVKFTHSILAIAVAQLPPPITANLILSTIFYSICPKVIKKLTTKKD